MPAPGPSRARARMRRAVAATVATALAAACGSPSEDPERSSPAVPGARQQVPDAVGDIALDCLTAGSFAVDLALDGAADADLVALVTELCGTAADALGTLGGPAADELGGLVVAVADDIAAWSSEIDAGSGPSSPATSADGGPLDASVPDVWFEVFDRTAGPR